MNRNEQEAGLVLGGVRPWISKEKVWPLLSMCMLCWLSGHFIIKTTLTGESRLRFITSLAQRENKEHFSKMASTWDVSPSSSCPALMQLIRLYKYWKCYAGTKERSGIVDVFISFCRFGIEQAPKHCFLQPDSTVMIWLASGSECPATSWEPDDCSGVLFNKLVQKRHKCRSANCHKAHIHQQGPDFVINPPYWIKLYNGPNLHF